MTGAHSSIILKPESKNTVYTLHVTGPNVEIISESKYAVNVQELFISGPYSKVALNQGKVDILTISAPHTCVDLLFGKV